MEEEIRDALEVPGHVLEMKFESITVGEATKELQALLDKYEAKGAKKLSDIPRSSPDRKRFEVLLYAIQQHKKEAKASGKLAY